MSKCSKKCNELKEKINNISGLDDIYVYSCLCTIENILDDIDKYADKNILNGTSFKNYRVDENAKGVRFSSCCFPEAEEKHIKFKQNIEYQIAREKASFITDKSLKDDIIGFLDSIKELKILKEEVVDLNEAIKQCRTIGECEVGTIRKMAINRLIEEVEKREQE